MDLTAGLQPYNKSSPVFSRVSKTIMVSVNITEIYIYF